MQKIFICCCLLCCLLTAVYAENTTQDEAQILGSDKLQSALPDSAQKVLSGLQAEASSGSFLDGLKALAKSALDSIKGYLQETFPTAAIFLTVGVLCHAVAGTEKGVARWAAVLSGLLAFLGGSGGDCTEVYRQTQMALDEIVTFGKTLLMVLSSALTASGGLTSGTVLYTVSMFALSILSQAINKLLLPLVPVYLLLSAANCADGQGRLAGIKNFSAWIITKGLRILSWLFVALLSVSGIFSGSADTLRNKAAKAALSGSLPVVGGIVSDASETILTSAGLLKNSFGVFGLLGVLAIGMTPLIHLGCSYLVMKLTAALSAALCLPEHQALLEDLTQLYGFLFAMLATTVFMLLVAVCCFMKAVGYG